jgi:hypothetical protein
MLHGKISSTNICGMFLISRKNDIIKLKGDKAMKELDTKEWKEVDIAFAKHQQTVGPKANDRPYRMFVAGWKAKKEVMEEQEAKEIDEKLKDLEADDFYDRCIKKITEVTELTKATMEDIQSICDSYREGKS